MDRLAGKQSAVCPTCKRDVRIYLPRVEVRGDFWLYVKHRKTDDSYCERSNDTVDTEEQETAE